MNRAAAGGRRRAAIDELIPALVAALDDKDQIVSEMSAGVLGQIIRSEVEPLGSHAARRLKLEKMRVPRHEVDSRRVSHPQQNFQHAGRRRTRHRRDGVGELKLRVDEAFDIHRPPPEKFDGRSEAAAA